jgi:hypothetical protein
MTKSRPIDHDIIHFIHHKKTIKQTQYKKDIEIISKKTIPVE